MKKGEIFIALIVVAIVISGGFLFAKNLTPQKMQEIDTEIIASVDKRTGTSIQKKETDEYYYYSIEDYDRNLSYSWKFLKKEDQNISVESSLNIDADLRLSIDALTNDTKTINEMVDQNKLIVTFDHHGDLPLEATVKINVQNRFNEGDKLYLYYYNPEKSQIEYIDHNVKVENGHVEFTIEHCSDYFLTAAVVNDAVGNPQSINYIIIGLVAVVFVLVAINLIQSKNK